MAAACRTTSPRSSCWPWPAPPTGVLTDDEFDFNPDLIGVLNDGIDANDSEFGGGFPYLAQPHRGLDFRSNGDWGATD